MELGKAYGKNHYRTYVITSVQPAYDVIIAWLYHDIWEKLTWRIWRWLERFQTDASWDKMPFTARQDCRCYDLNYKNREVLHTSYGPKVDYNDGNNLS